MAAPPKKYWLKHDCKDGTIHAGMSGPPLAFQEVPVFNETTLREAMIQYAWIWLRMFQTERDDTTILHDAVTFDFKGYRACVYQDDFEEIARFFETDDAEEAGHEIAVISKYGYTRKGFSNVVEEKDIQMRVGGSNAKEDVHYDLESVNNVTTLTALIHLHDKITLVAEKQASYIQWKQGTGGFANKHRGYREREA